MIENNSSKKMQESFLYPKSTKVLALYGAVRDLLQEGTDLVRLKVSDIAARAGIGKGTTYDYFKSREELIVKAVLYHIYHHMQEVERRVYQENSFQDRIYVLMDILFDPYGPDKKMAEQILMFFFNAENGFPDRFREEFQKCAPSLRNIKGILMRLYQDGVKEGIIEDGLHIYYIRTAFMNMLIHYTLYKQAPHCKEAGDIPPVEEIKKRLYENLIYELRKA